MIGMSSNRFQRFREMNVKRDYLSGLPMAFGAAMGALKTAFKKRKHDVSKKKETDFSEYMKMELRRRALEPK